MAIVLGMNCIIGYTDGGFPSEVSSFTTLDDVKDVTLNLETGTSDITTRGNDGFRASAPTLKDGSVDFSMVWDTGDAGFIAIKNAFFDNTDICLAIFDGAIATGSGLAGVYRIHNFTRSEPLEEAVTVSVTARLTLAPGGLAPTWYDSGYSIPT